MGHATRQRMLGAALVAGVLLGGCTGSDGGATPSVPAATTAPDDAATGPTDAAGGDGPVAQPVQFGLTQAASCDEVLDHFVTNGLEHVSAWGLGGADVVFMEEDMAVAESGDDSAGVDSAESLAAQPEEEPAFSTTNVQEQGVDEPDVVKTDGERIVLVRDDRLLVVDVETAEVVGRLALGDEVFGAQLLLDGDDLVVLADGSHGGIEPMTSSTRPAFSVARTVVLRVDLAGDEPALVGSTTIEGSIRSARMVDGTVRLVVETNPTGLVFTMPEDGGLAAEQDALEANRDVIRDSDIDDWLPHRRSDGGDVERLVECEDVAVPATFEGFATLSVVTMAIDDDAMVPSSSAGVVASGETVYASTDRLVVATSPWGQWRMPFLAADAALPEDGPVTELHVFDISDPASTSFVASGSVPGVLVNQFALSEVDGILRAATTMQPSWWGGGADAESMLVVLEERGDELAEVGRVAGMGLTERIYAVRYLSPELAAIVTFRETDPLYLVDTSDPTAPAVVGELKIPGFSTYLHPIGEGMLVGIGQDADEDGRTTGLQVSLFDVSDTTDPRRVDQVGFGPGSSPAEYDHHAFTWWAPTGRVLVPAELYPEEPWVEEMPPEDDVVERAPEGKPFVGVLAVDVDGSSMTAGPRAAQAASAEPWQGWVERTIVIGDDVWSLGHDTLARHDLETLEVDARVRLN